MFGRKKKNKEPKEAPEKKEEGKPRKRRFSPKLLFAVLVLLTVGVLAGLYFTGIFPAKAVNGALPSLEKVEIDEPLLKFTNARLPEIYERLAAINGEILLIEKEIARIQEIEKAFPGQKKITSSEIKAWDRTRKNLQKSLSNLEKNIEQFYVAYRVNREKGEKLMESKKASLTGSVDGVLGPARKQTERLKPRGVPEEDLSTFGRIKNKILGFIPFIGKK